MDLYVLPLYNGYYVDVNAQKNIPATYGESLSEHYGFLQQALNQLATVKFDDSLSLIEKVEVTIYLGKGTHFFFACVEAMNANLDQLAGSVTDFCKEIDSLKLAYMKTDNMKLTVKPLDCIL